MIRLQKILADAGIASRRAAEQFITAGRVTVNGKAVSQLGAKADPERDRIAVDGDPVKIKRKIYLALHKPKGVLCTRKDPEGRPSIMDLLPAEWSNVYPVGRLDRESEGLIFLTNDGDFCLRQTHPRYQVRKTYVVTVAGRFHPDGLGRLRQGVEHEGERLKAAFARLISSSNSVSVLEIVITEGKNHEVRRMMEVLGHEVLRLVRLQIGSIKLASLKPGRWRTLTAPEIKTLLATV